MEEEALMFEASVVQPFEWQREHYAVAASVVIFGGGSLWLLHKLRKNGAITIKPETRICLRKSAGYALASWGIACAPTFLVRKLGWERCRPLYNEVLFSNPYTTAASLVLPLAFTGFAVAFPSKKSPSVKKDLWAASCVSVGTVLAPLFFQPRDILTIVGGFVVGLTVPVAVALSTAANFFVLNLVALLGMVGGTVFMKSSAIPFLLLRRNGSIPVSSQTILNFTFGTTLLTALVLLVGTNGFVYYVNKCHEKTEEEKKKLFMIYDGTDPVSNGMIIAGSIGFVFAKLLHKVITLPRRLWKSKETKPELKSESNAAFDTFKSLMD